MKNFFLSLWFWALVLGLFLWIILGESEFEKEAQSKYVKQKMKLTDVHFSEIDKGFEHARMFADSIDMDDSQTNMYASRVRSLFFDREVATRTGELVASWGIKNPFEARFWGDVKIRTSDGERLRSDELRYILSAKDLVTTMPVTIWKDDMVITGRDLRYNTQRKEGLLQSDVLIRIWSSASETAKASGTRKVREAGRASGTGSIGGSSPFPGSDGIHPQPSRPLASGGTMPPPTGPSTASRPLIRPTPPRLIMPPGVATAPRLASSTPSGAGRMQRPGEPSSLPTATSTATAPEVTQRIPPSPRPKDLPPNGSFPDIRPPEEKKSGISSGTVAPRRRFVASSTQSESKKQANDF